MIYWHEISCMMVPDYDFLCKIRVPSPLSIFYSAAISACEKGRQWERALGSMKEMNKQSLQANVITYSATISACGKGRA